MNNPSRASFSRRGVLGAAAAAAGGLSAGFTPWSTERERQASAAQATPVATPVGAPDPAAITAIVENALTAYKLKAAIVRVLIDGEEIVTVARGESMTGIPATTEMRFHNGSVAMAYMGTALLVLVDQGVVGLDDPLANWLPDLPNAEQVTLRMLPSMTAGYQDYVVTPEFQKRFYADPFGQFTPEDLIEISLKQGLPMTPGTNFAYAHTDFIILGLALEGITKQPLADVLRDLVLDPLGLVDTVSAETAAIPEPALHAFSSERRDVLGIASGVRFYEESTYWNPSWTIAPGAVQTTTIADMAASAVAFGEGTLLSPELHQAQIAKKLDFGGPLKGCLTCRAMDEQANFGIGVLLLGDWILQNPSFGGFSGIAAYLPSHKLAIAATVTLAEDGFDETGGLFFPDGSLSVATEIAALLAPESPLQRPGR